MRTLPLLALGAILISGAAYAQQEYVPGEPPPESQARSILDWAGGKELALPKIVVLPDQEFVRRFRHRIGINKIRSCGVYWIKTIYLSDGACEREREREVVLAHELTHYVDFNPVPKANAPTESSLSAEASECRAYANGARYAEERGWFNYVSWQYNLRRQYKC